MANYPALIGPPPVVFTAEHIRAAEEAIRQLAIVDHVLKKCERCKIPVSELRADCDGLCDFFQRFLAEETGQQAELPAAVR